MQGQPLPFTSVHPPRFRLAFLDVEVTAMETSKEDMIPKVYLLIGYEFVEFVFQRILTFPIPSRHHWRWT
jgi:hypothetical protein